MYIDLWCPHCIVLSPENLFLLLNVFPPRQGQSREITKVFDYAWILNATMTTVQFLPLIKRNICYADITFLSWKEGGDRATLYIFSLFKLWNITANTFADSNIQSHIRRIFRHCMRYRFHYGHQEMLVVDLELIRLWRQVFGCWSDIQILRLFWNLELADLFA